MSPADTLTSGPGAGRAVPTPAAEVTSPPAASHPRGRRVALLFATVGVATIAANETRLGEWAVSDLLFLVTAAVILSQLLAGRPSGLAPAAMRRSPILVLLGSVVMLTAGTLSSFWSRDPVTSMTVILRYAWLTLGWFWILRSVVPDRAALDRLLGGLRIGVLVSAAAALGGYVGLVQDATTNGDRQSAFFVHPNGLAGFLVMGLPFLLLGVPTAWARPARSVVLTRVVPSALGIFALATTGSLTAALAAIVAIAAVVLLGVVKIRAPSRARQRRLGPLGVVAVVALGGLGIVALLGSDTQVVERFTDYRAGDVGIQSSAESREEGAGFVIERFDHYLVLGVGFDRTTAGNEYSQAQGEGRVGGGYGAGGSGIHSMLPKMYFEGGGVTVLGFLVIVFGTVQLGVSILGRSRDDPSLRAVALACVGSMAGLNVLAQFQPMGFERFYWLPVALLVVTWTVRRQELRSASASASASVPGHRAP